jgi:HK97 family phage prohead protease
VFWILRRSGSPLWRSIKNIIISPKMDNKMLHFQANFKAVDDAANDVGVRVRGYASTKDVDRGNDVVKPKAFEESIRTSYKDNPMILFQHDRNKPIGKAVSMSIDSKGLLIEAIIYDEEIGALVKQGVLKTFSIGYLPEEIEYRDKDNAIVDPNEQSGMLRIWTEEGIKRIIKKLELLEVSIVSLPMNASALFSLAKSLDTYFESEKAEFLSNNPNNMDKKDPKNLLTKEDEAAVDGTPAEETPEETPEEKPEETTETEETPEEETSETTEEAETEEGETPSASEEETEEVEDGEKTDDDEGSETPAEEVESDGDAEEVVEEEESEVVEEDAEKGIDAKLVTKENLDLALKAAQDLKLKNAALEAKVKGLQAEIDNTPVKKAKVYSHSLPSKYAAERAAKEGQKGESGKKGFKAAIENAA